MARMNRIEGEIVVVSWVGMVARRWVIEGNLMFIV